MADRNKLTLDDLGPLLEELMCVRDQWYRLGLQLKVRPEALDTIRTQFSDPRDQLLKVLKTWLTTSDNTSWKTLTDALRRRSVGQRGLADDLVSKYKVEETEVHEKAQMSASRETQQLPLSLQEETQMRNKLIVNDLHLLLEELMDVRSQWYDLGLYLGIQTVERIRVQFPDPRDRLLEVLKTWLTTSDNTSWKSLSDTLRSKSVEAYQLAGGLERKYCLTKDMRERNILTKDDHALLVEELDHAFQLDDLANVHEQWYRFGLQLKVSTKMLDRIREEFPDPKDQLPEMLKAWLTSSDNTSWKTLTDALKSQSVGCYLIADYLESKYCPMKDMSETVQSPPGISDPSQDNSTPLVRALV